MSTPDLSALQNAHTTYRGALEERNRLIVRHYRQGVPALALARALGVSKQAIFQILDRHGVDRQSKRG